MANVYNKENISFNNVQKPKVATGYEGIWHPFMDNTESYGMSLSEYLNTNRTTAIVNDFFTVNAIDIHWNGAQIESSTTINATGELIKVIQG